jgi:hypothetical protein
LGHWPAKPSKNALFPKPLPKKSFIETDHIFC